MRQNRPAISGQNSLALTVNKMVKWCFNYESGDYEYIEKDGFSIDRGEYVYNWDDSEYRREEDDERRNSLFNDGDD